MIDKKFWVDEKIIFQKEFSLSKYIFRKYTLRSVQNCLCTRFWSNAHAFGAMHTLFPDPFQYFFIFFTSVPILKKSCCRKNQIFWKKTSLPATNYREWLPLVAATLPSPLERLTTTTTSKKCADLRGKKSTKIDQSTTCNLLLPQPMTTKNCERSQLLTQWLFDHSEANSMKFIGLYVENGKKELEKNP